MTNVIKMDTFEYPQDTVVAVEVGGESRNYQIRELSSAEGQQIFGLINKGTDDEKADAALKLQSTLISKCVSREDGTPFTVADAGKIRISLAKQLQDAVLRVNGLQADEAELKNE